MPATDNAVVQALKSFPVSGVYFLASKYEVVEGFRHHEEQRVKAYSWNKDFSVLEADLRVDGLNAVSFWVEQSKLGFGCDCRVWKPETHCAHVIGALLTTINLLTPHQFPRRREDPRYLDPLKRMLAGDTTTPAPVSERASQSRQAGRIVRDQPGGTLPHPSSQQLAKHKPTGKFAIVLENKEGASHIQVQRDGHPVYYGYGPQLPKELAPVSYWYTLSKPATSTAFVDYLQQHAGKHPIALQTSHDERTEVRWDPTLKCRKQTQLNLTAEGVCVKAICLFEGLPLHRFEVFGDLVADLEEKRLGSIEEGRGWTLYQQLHRIHLQNWYSGGMEKPIEGGPLGAGSFLLPLESLRDIEIFLPRPAHPEMSGLLALQVAGQPVEPQPGQVRHRLTIDTLTGSNGSPRLIAALGLEDRTEIPPHGVFDFFLTLESRELPGALHSQARRTTLCDGFFKLPAVRNSAEGQKLIRETLAASDIMSFRFRKIAMDLLRKYLQKFLVANDRLVAAGGRWYQIPEDKRKQSLLYQIPYSLFGPQIFKSMEAHGVMSLPALPKGAPLQALFSALQKQDIDLYINGKPVVATRWEFSIDATRASGIDWFEIRPEIQCNGVTLSEAEWLEALGNHGVREGDEVVEMLDSDSREILESVAEILKARARSKEKREIVEVQRLQILDWIALRKHGVKVKLSPEEEAVVERLLHFEKIDVTPLPERLHAKLRPYQKEGFHWLAFLYQNRLGACLADDMGLGKTLQAITLLGALCEGVLRPSAAQPLGPHLVVLPPSLLFNWESELKRFYPELRIGFYTGKERSTEFKSYDVVLTTYGMVRKDIEKLKEHHFHVIVFDEAQAVKNIFANTTGATRQLRGYFKLALTGTPLENHLGEYFSILDLCLPGLMGDYEQFRAFIKMERSPMMDMLVRRTRPFVLRRTKDAILKELPPKTESDVYLELTEKQKSLYQHTVAQVRSSIEDAYRSKTQGQAQIIALTAIMKLRQLCVSPRLLDRSSKDPSPKLDFVIGKLKELRDEGHSALVFSQFTSFLDLLEEELRASELAFSRLDGSTAVKKRKHLVEGFQKGEAPSIFLLSLKAGGQGLNLTRASYVFHLDPWWNPAVENQASDRAHRIGQVQKVSITRVLMRHTIEEKMMELKKRKLALYKAVLEDATRAGKGFSISKSDFDFLLGG